VHEDVHSQHHKSSCDVSKESRIDYSSRTEHNSRTRAKLHRFFLELSGVEKQLFPTNALSVESWIALDRGILRIVLHGLECDTNCKLFSVSRVPFGITENKSKGKLGILSQYLSNRS
jgi:hypothetical protein